MKPARKVAAAEFKAKCLDLLDQVAVRGDSFIVTKRGRPVAKVVPLMDPEPRGLRGSVTYHEDIVSPLGEDWPVDE